MPTGPRRERYRETSIIDFLRVTGSGTYYGAPYLSSSGHLHRYTKPHYSHLTDSKNRRDKDGDLPVAFAKHFRVFPYVGLHEFSWVSRRGPERYGLPNTKTFNLVIDKDAVPFHRSDGTDPYYGLANSWSSFPASLDLVDFGRAAQGAICQQFPEKISILNFLWELRELPAMLLQLAAKVRSFKDLNGYTSSLTPNAIANDYLAYSFGWKPLLGDLQSLASVMSSIDDRLDHLRRTKGKPVRAGLTRKLPSDVSRVYVQRYDVSSGHVQHVHLERVFKQVTLVASGRVLNNFDWLDHWSARYRAAFGILGFSNPLKILWNAMPFSFIIDWLTDISGLLSSMAVIQQSTDWKVDRLTYSWTTNARFELSVVDAKWNSSDPNPELRYPLGYFDTRMYERNIGLPINKSDAVFRFPTPQQLVLMAALGTGKS